VHIDHFWNIGFTEYIYLNLQGGFEFTQLWCLYMLKIRPSQQFYSILAKFTCKPRRLCTALVLSRQSRQFVRTVPVWYLQFKRKLPMNVITDVITFIKKTFIKKRHEATKERSMARKH